MAKQITMTVQTGHENYQGEIQPLVRQALSFIGTEDEPCAVWRLVDAVGMLAERYPDAIGVAYTTGRGYKIIHR